MRRIILLTVLTVLITGVTVNAQNLNKVYGAMDEGDFEVALSLLEPIMKKKPKNLEAKMLAGICHTERYRLEEAIGFFKESAAFGKEVPFYYVKFAKAYLLDEQIDAAEQTIRRVRLQDLEDFLRPEYILVSTNIQNAKKYLPNPADIIIKNLGPNINSEGNEYSQVVTEDQRGIYFTARRKGSSKVGDDGEPIEQVLSADMDDKDEWNKDEPLEGFNGSRTNEAPIQLTNGDSTLLTFIDEDLFVYTKDENGRWKKKAFPFNSKRWESHAYIYNNGQSMIFASDVNHDVENLDLYYTQMGANGRWSRPQPIVELNTPLNDDAPFVAEDGTLYFSSRGHDSMGGYDIFKTTFDSTAGKFRTPENMGAPINLPNDDTFFTLYGKNAYLSSSRPGGYGQVDIYRIIMFSESQVQGRLIDCEGDAPIGNAKVTVVGEEDKYFTTSDETGVYRMSLPIEEKFTLRVEKEGKIVYEREHEVRVLFRDEFDINQDFYLGCERGDNVRYIKLINSFDLDPTNLPVAPPEGLTPVEEVSAEVPEEPEPVEEVIADVPTAPVVADEIILPNVYFAFDKHQVRSPFFQRLDEAAELLMSRKDLRIMVAGHTDAYGTNPYNVALGVRRYTEVYNYLINKGVSADQMEVETFSENNPLQSNRTVRGRAFNRRVMLYFID